jgi:NAD(P)-dependent dehydrogenase (short-subunit alcohol dehydrogenase family)
MAPEKVWFITGTSRGFGRIWAEAALERGDKVAATARDASSLRSLIEKFGDAVLPLTLDVTNRAAVFAAIGSAQERFGRLDVILSNAGYGYVGAIEEMSIDDVRANYEANVFGTLSVIQAALPVLRKQRSGHILTVSSIGGVVAFPTGGSYTATKWAIEALSEALAGEVAGFGIKVTIIEPGSFATDFRGSLKIAPAIAEYAPVHEAVLAGFRPDQSGNPSATAAAILKVVDAPQPPLRLLLGSGPLPLIKKVYAARLDNWDSWSNVSNEAQGARS